MRQHFRITRKAILGNTRSDCAKIRKKVAFIYIRIFTLLKSPLPTNPNECHYDGFPQGIESGRNIDCAV